MYSPSSTLLTLGAYAPEGYCSCPCPSVRPLVGNSLLKRLFILKTLSHTQRATKVKKICGDFPETTAFKSYAVKQERRSQYANYSDLPAVSFLRLTHSEASEGYPTIVNNIQPCPKLCLLMPLARDTHIIRE